MTVIAKAAAARRELAGFGRTSKSAAEVVRPASLEQLQELVAGQAGAAAGVLARGAGLSYGDAAQNGGGVVVSPVTGPGVELDATNELVTASAGTTFAEILTRVVPGGFILPVLPGTRHLTVGGAVGADVHGKNHRQAGSLAAWIDQIDLVDGTGGLRRLTPGSDPAGLQATCGGMGLTGIVVAASIRLRRIETGLIRVTARRTPDLDATLSVMAAATTEYSVAWVDATASGRSLGRGIVETADHALLADVPAASPSLSYRQQPGLRMPALPVPIITPLTARAFNSLWFAKAPGERTGLVDLATFFHRLDAVSGWNRAAGPDGLIQYQFVVPAGAENIIAAVLDAVQRSRCAPFLGTLKRFGAISAGPLSFPAPGWCLAVDLPAGAPSLRALLAGLDIRVASAGGRVYLAKDATLSQNAFESMYSSLPAWREARARLDPLERFQSDLGRRVGLC
ncbi:MAG TPA: FAD-binding oxidoreductase [Streptosporangiaceae bacterium]